MFKRRKRPAATVGAIAQAEAEGYTATRHQREVGVGYFDAVAMAISGGKSSTTALSGSTETAQFHDQRHRDELVHNHDRAVPAK